MNYFLQESIEECTMQYLRYKTAFAVGRVQVPEY
jgi:hypothetical protein